MVELVESIPDHEQIQKAAVQYLYAFALSRRNQPGDRDKAIVILEKVIILSMCPSSCVTLPACSSCVSLQCVPLPVCPSSCVSLLYTCSHV